MIEHLSTLLTPQVWRDRVRVFQSFGYRWYWIGLLVSFTGTWVQSVAQGWLLYRLTHSPIILTLAGLATDLPVFCLALVAGVVADRVERKRLLIVVQLAMAAQALTLAFLTGMHWIGAQGILLLAVFLGVCNAFDMTTRQAYLSQVVDRDQLPAAIALGSAAFNMGRFLGPILAGLLVPWFGESVCFALNGITFIFFAWALRIIPAIERPIPKEHQPVWHGMKEAYAWIRSSPSVTRVFYLLACESFFAIGLLSLTPIVAGDMLQGNVRTYGMLMTACGVGCVIGAMTIVILGTTERRLLRLMMIAIIIYAAGLTVLGLSRSAGMAYLSMGVLGIGLLGSLVAANTFLQYTIPEALRARVLSFYVMLLVGLAPIGGLLGGIFAHQFGVPLVLTASGILLLAASWLRPGGARLP